MPNKTIYVSDADLPVFQRAQELAGGATCPRPSPKPCIASSRSRKDSWRDSRRSPFESGSGRGKLQRFQGVLLADWNRSTATGVERYRAYRTRAGKLAVHVSRPKGFVHTAGKDGQLTGWRKHFATDQQWGRNPPAAAILEVFDTFEDLRAEVPPAELAALVEVNATEPEVEDLDI